MQYKLHTIFEKRGQELGRSTVQIDGRSPVLQNYTYHNSRLSQQENFKTTTSGSCAKSGETEDYANKYPVGKTIIEWDYSIKTYCCKKVDIFDGISTFDQVQTY